MASQRPNRPLTAGANSTWISWHGLVYYGETVGFLIAWIAGVTVILAATHPDAEKAVDRVAVVAPTAR